MGRYALLVGVSAYDDPRFQELRAPTHDVRQLATLLRDPDIGSYDVRTLVDADARTLQVAIAELTAARTRDDTVLLYLSCHGVKDATGRLYFAATDTRDALTAATGVPSSYVQEQFERCTAGVRVQLLDCCFSAAFATGFTTRSADRVLSREDFGRGYVAITATNHFEYAWEPTSPVVSEEPTTSVFTDAVLAALADETADRDRDGWISDRDLYEYVHRVVRERTAGAQTPTHFAFDLQGTVVLAKAVGAQPAQAPPPPMSTAPAPPPPSPMPPDEPADAEVEPTPPGRFVFRADEHLDFAALQHAVGQDEMSVNTAILAAWGQFNSYLKAVRQVAGFGTYGENAPMLRRLLEDGATAATTVTAAQVVVGTARNATTTVAGATRLGMRRLGHFLADLTAVAREIDAVFDVAPPVFGDLAASVPEDAAVEKLRDCATAGFVQFGVYLDRVARAWGIPRREDSVSEPDRDHGTEASDVPEAAGSDSETERAAAWLAEKSGDPDMAPLVREVQLLHGRIDAVGGRDALGRYLDDLTTIAGELEEHARTVQHRRAARPTPTTGPTRTSPVRTSPVRTRATPARSPSSGTSLSLGDIGLILLVVLAICGVFSAILFGVGPTHVGFRSSSGDNYQVEHNVSYVPGRTRFVWDLGKGAEVKTTLRTTDADHDIKTLSGNIRLAAGGTLCKDAAVKWTIKGENIDVSGTSQVRNGEAGSFELDDKDIKAEHPGKEVEFTARRTDGGDCKTQLQWTRPGFDE